MQLESQSVMATGSRRFGSPLVWRNVKQYLGRPFMRKRHLREFFGILLSASSRNSKVAEQDESQAARSGDKIIIFQ